MTAPYYQDEHVTVHAGDCLDVMASLPAESVHAIVTDPPYGLGFMGREWDGLPPGEPWARECLRVLKPGGHLLAFGGSRTWHRLAVTIEDAGFEVRDSIAWLYGSGFPKSLDVSKAIDKAQGATGTYGEPKSSAHAGWLDKGRMRGGDGNEGWQRPWMQDEQALSNAARKYEAGSPEAQEYAGWGTALKPAFEPIVVARKPLTGTVAANVLAHGTGALNIDATRVDAAETLVRPAVRRDDNDVLGKGLGAGAQTEPAGRWPTNVLLDDTQAAELDRQSGESKSPPVGSVANTKGGNTIGTFAHEGRAPSPNGHGDQGGASRFFPTFRYEAKAPTAERPRVNGIAHPTVKPLDLMRWLVRLVTPPGGTVLDPFAGSGTTLEAALIEGFQCIGIERETDYLPLIKARITKPLEPVLNLGALA